MRRAVALGALVLGLLVAWGATLSVRGHRSRGASALPPHRGEDTVAPKSLLGEEPSPAPAPAASPLPRQPLPQPLVAPPVSTPEKGTPVNTPSVPGSELSPRCALRSSPRRAARPQWLKWCKCAAIVGSLAATQAGCPAVQVRQSLTEECSQASVEAMKLLEVEFHRSDRDNDIVVELDVKQPNKGSNEACDHDVPGGVPRGLHPGRPCHQPGAPGLGQVGARHPPRGPSLVPPPSRFGEPNLDPLFRWTEATLPDGSKHPVCIEATAQGNTCPNGASRECAARPAEIVKRWRQPLTR